MKRIINDDISIVICGEAGQGIQTVEKLLTGIFKAAGYNVFATKEYMSRIRGGSNSTELRITSSKVSAFVDKIDLHPGCLNGGDLDDQRVIVVVDYQIHTGKTDHFVELVSTFVYVSETWHEGTDLFSPFLNPLRQISSNFGNL